MQYSGLKIESLNNELNKRIEVLVGDQGIKESELREKENEISKICTEIKEMETQLRDLRLEKLKAEADFIKAEEQLRNAEEQLRRQKKKRKKARGFGGFVGAVVGVVAGLTIGPLAGLAIGGLTFAACKSMDDVVNVARNMRDIAEQNRDRQRERVAEKKEDISSAQKELSDRKSERDAIKIEIEQLKEKIKYMRQKLARQTTIGLNMKQCNTYISIAKGRTELLHDQTRFLYHPSTLLRPLHELASHLSLPGANRLGMFLCENKVGLMVLKVKMIAEADDRWRKTDLLEHEKGFIDFYTPPHDSDGILWYHVGRPYVCPSVRLSYIRPYFCFRTIN